MLVGSPCKPLPRADLNATAFDIQVRYARNHSADLAAGPYDGGGSRGKVLPSIWIVFIGLKWYVVFLYGWHWQRVCNSAPNDLSAQQAIGPAKLALLAGVAEVEHDKVRRMVLAPIASAFDARKFLNT